MKWKHTSILQCTGVCPSWWEELVFYGIFLCFIQLPHKGTWLFSKVPARPQATPPTHHPPLPLSVKHNVNGLSLTLPSVATWWMHKKLSAVKTVILLGHWPNTHHLLSAGTFLLREAVTAAFTRPSPNPYGFSSLHFSSVKFYLMFVFLPMFAAFAYSALPHPLHPATLKNYRPPGKGRKCAHWIHSEFSITPLKHSCDWFSLASLFTAVRPKK